MTGAKDPDCRRGMLWDEARQDKDMLAWYRRLLQLRKDVPAITKGETVSERAINESGVITMTKRLSGEEITLLFCNKDSELHLPEYSGKTDLITGTIFDGNLRKIGAIVLK